MKEKATSLRWFIWVPFLVLIDQLTKSWILKTLSIGETIPLMPGLRLTLAHNYGIAFGMFNNDNLLVTRFILLAIAIVITVFISVWLYKTPRTEKWVCSALVLILGGALGNIIDRFMHGHVIDFIDCYYKNWHWWTFNIADSFITVGAVLLLKTILFEEKDSSKAHKA